MNILSNLDCQAAVNILNRGLAELGINLEVRRDTGLRLANPKGYAYGMLRKRYANANGINAHGFCYGAEYISTKC